MGELRCFIFEDHFVVTDGCNVNLGESPVLSEEGFSKLAKDQHESEALSRRGTIKPKFLYYANTGIVRPFLESRSLKIHCPVCNEYYEITLEHFNSAHNDAKSLGDILNGEI